MMRRARDVTFFLALVGLLAILPPGGFSAWTWTSGQRWLYIFFIAFFLCSLAIPLAGYAAGRLGAVDRPGPRRVHSYPTPRLGGLAVFLALALALLRNQQYSAHLLGIAAGAAIIFVLGFLDDVRSLSARTRLFWQVAAAAVTAGAGLKLTFAQHLPGGEVLSFVLTVLWLVGITNAFNFMDGIDGLASAMGAVCSLLFVGIAWNSSQYEVAFLSAALAGACSGFLTVNWHPARMFLGDGGSTLIGFLLGCLAVYGSWATGNPAVALSTPLLVLGIPVFDIIYTTISRVKNGQVSTVKEWLEYTGRDHFHHRLMKLGLGVRQTVAFILLLNLCLGLGAWTVRHTASTTGTIFLLLQSVMIFSIVVVLMLLGRDRTEEGESGRGTR